MKKSVVLLFLFILFVAACSTEQEKPVASSINSEPCGDGVCDSTEQAGNGCPQDCATEEESSDDTELEDSSQDMETITGTDQGAKVDVSDEIMEAGSWVPSSNGAWSGSIILASSDDGLTFTQGETLVDYAGVPNLLLTSDGTLIASYQYFSREDYDMYDVIAYSVSEDQGKTWTDPEKISFEGLPIPTTGTKEGMFVTKAVDPTLVETSDGALRLYFTYQEKDEEQPHLASALASDGNIASTFVYEEGERPILDDAPMLDPAVVYFDGLWHHYSWNEDSEDNYHSLSEDGINFELQDNIEDVGMEFLGQVIAVDGGLRFYGTKNGISSAFSEDGFTWEKEDGSRMMGADPGVVELEDGSYLMLYTSSNFNN